MRWIELVGRTFPIHGVRHTCIAASDDALLMLQYEDDGTPCQYVVAHDPYQANGELCWLNGDYFPFFHYATTAEALLAAADDYGKMMTRRQGGEHHAVCGSTDGGEGQAELSQGDTGGTGEDG